MTGHCARGFAAGHASSGKTAWFLWLVWTLLVPFMGAADQLSIWNSRSSGSSGDFYSVAYGDGTFVAVGIGGQLYSSPNGVNWTPQVSGTTNILNSVTCGNGLF